MKSTRMLAAVAVAAIGIGGAGTAMAAKTKPAPKKITITTSDKSSYKINRGVFEGLKYNKDVYTVKSGGTITWISNAKKQDAGPHTLSLVKAKKYLPRTKKAIDACGNGGGVCGPLGAAHEFNPQTGAVAKPIYDTGKPGFDVGGTKKTAGDSVYSDPTTPKTVKIHVSAKKGTTLYLVCAIHPWMQAKLLVK
jgi:plastocyanin